MQPLMERMMPLRPSAGVVRPHETFMPPLFQGESLYPLP